MSTRTSLEIKSDLAVSFKTLLEKGIMNFKEIIAEISQFASKELLIESALKKMKEEWSKTEFTLKQFPNTETFIIISVENLWDLLDESLARTFSLLSSSYIKKVEK